MDVEVAQVAAAQRVVVDPDLARQAVLDGSAQRLIEKITAASLAHGEDHLQVAQPPAAAAFALRYS